MPAPVTAFWIRLAVFFSPALLSLMLRLEAAESPAPDGPAFPVVVEASQDEFCLIVVPDTQRYAAYFPSIFRKQFEWIRDAVKLLNIKYVIHAGDVVEENTTAEWVVADDAFSLLDGVVAYLVVPGNHDLEREAARAGIRATTRFNAVFSPKRFAGQPWFGGVRGVTADNSFGYFEAAGRQFLVLGLEFGPSDETLNWARELVSNHEDRHRVIVVTHSYMFDDDSRLGEGDAWSPHLYSPAWNDGEQIWEKFVRRTRNVVMVLSGHVKGDGAGRLVSETDDGTPVLQMLANYQFLGHGGQGWLRILKFRPRERTLEVFTYSPWLDEFREEKDHRFTADVSAMFP
ncbi:MAG: metallophosphoesterase [Opitutaceae bacterium]